VSIDYHALDTHDLERLAVELPRHWLAAYHAMCDGPTNVHILTTGGFTYLFDCTTELGVEREDRVVAAFGVSRRQERTRHRSRIEGFPPPLRGDRGHFLAHSIGGGTDINLFHQDTRLNRGWSVEGKKYRAMESYCASHPGTFCFARPLYTDASACPSSIEYGVLRNRKFWVEVFKNVSAG